MNPTELRDDKMKKALLTRAILILLFIPAQAAAQSLSDYCHVYVFDLKVVEAALKKYPTGNDQEDEKLLTSGITIIGNFAPKIGEEELTTKTYKLPGNGWVITASVFYTDESMYASKLKTQDSMAIGVAVGEKAYESAFEEAQNSAIAEVPYTEHADTVRVKTFVSIRKRKYMVGLECRLMREFDETDPKRKK